MAAVRLWTDRLILGLATGGGLGLIPWAPGTWGTLGGPLLAWAWYHAPWYVQLLLWLCGAAVGVPLCTQAAKLLGKHDPGSVVWDEIMACAAVLWLVPLTWTTSLLAFLWFRLFDISKPWPVKRFERFPDGWGIMADDLVAAIYARAGLELTLWLFPALAR